MNLRIRTYSELEGGDSDLAQQVGRQHERVAERLATVGRVVGVMSGKGGVGKSLVTACLATGMARHGLRVGVIDADVGGPSLVRMLGLDAGSLTAGEDGVEPRRSVEGVALMSMGLLVEEDAAVAWNEPAGAGFVWRGALERGALREFLADVIWGDLDVLLVDLPPGTQRLVELHELVPSLAGVLAVTIPSSASRDAVSRSLQLAAERELRVFGIIENLSGYRCGDCGAVGPLHPGDAAGDLSDRFEVPVLSRVPFDPELGEAAESGGLGNWFEVESDVAREFERVLLKLADDTGEDR